MKLADITPENAQAAADAGPRAALEFVRDKYRAIARINAKQFWAWYGDEPALPTGANTCPCCIRQWKDNNEPCCLSDKGRPDNCGNCVEEYVDMNNSTSLADFRKACRALADLAQKRIDELGD